MASDSILFQAVCEVSVQTLFAPLCIAWAVQADSELSVTVFACHFLLNSMELLAVQADSEVSVQPVFTTL